MGMPIIEEEMKEEKKQKTGFFGKVAKFFSKDSKNSNKRELGVAKEEDDDE